MALKYLKLFLREAKYNNKECAIIRFSEDSYLILDTFAKFIPLSKLKFKARKPLKLDWYNQ